jgi:hypothetical protein
MSKPERKPKEESSASRLSDVASENVVWLKNYVSRRTEVTPSPSEADSVLRKESTDQLPCVEKPPVIAPPGPPLKTARLTPSIAIALLLSVAAGVVLGMSIYKYFADGSASGPRAGTLEQTKVAVAVLSPSPSHADDERPQLHPGAPAYPPSIESGQWSKATDTFRWLLARQKVSQAAEIFRRLLEEQKVSQAAKSKLAESERLLGQLDIWTKAKAW